MRLAIALLLVPSIGWAEGGNPKSKDEILDGLLGGERAPGGMRQEQDGATVDGQGRIALPIRFEYNSARISPESAEQLRNVAQALNDPQLRGVRIRIEGHTDNRGSRAYNLRLSQARAAAVERYLVDKEGVEASRLDAAGYAFERPLPGVSQDTEEGRAANRRVEFVNLGTAAAAPAGIRGMTVDVVVDYKSGDQVRRVAPGAVLRTRDHYRVSFTPARDGYVYVYQVDATGNASSVYPNPQYSAARNPVKAKQRYVVPEGQEWLRLDERVGDREIVVLGTQRELSDPKAVVVGLLNEERAPAGTRADLAPEMPEDLFTYRLPFKNQ
jgi:outer membrane protein OmpA-like peptidoglycan-associated protein